MEYTINLTARVGAAAADPYLGDRLMTALEKRASAIVAEQNITAGTVGASFGIGADDAVTAITDARVIFASALAEAMRGEVVPLVFTEAQAAEDREEAAALA